MAKRIPTPFKYRDAWRAQVTCKNGTRPFADFQDYGKAKDWIVATLGKANTEHEPELGGPKQATLAEALNHYAGLHTINKGGIDSELNRINHYLAGGGLSLLRKAKNDRGQTVLETYTAQAQPSGWQDYNDNRRALRKETYQAIEALARLRCSVINTADIRRLMATMKSEGLSDSTIQKEVALLRHLFNVAAKEWQWKGFENPTEGLKLGGSQSRFVFITKEQEAALWAALAECDNPYVWPLVVCALETTLRRGSLLAMRWDTTDLDGRIAQVPSKTGFVNVPLSLHIVNVLKDMPRHASGAVFPLSSNAVKMAWEGVRTKAGLDTLQFRDIRHLGATAYARRGLNAHQLRTILGQRTLHMAQIYVNLVSKDILNAMDASAPTVPVIQVPPPASGGSAENIVRARRSARMAEAVRNRLQSGVADSQTSAVAPAGAETPVAVVDDVQLRAPMPALPAEDAGSPLAVSATMGAQASVPDAANASTEPGTPAPAPPAEKPEATAVAAPTQVATNVLMFRPRQQVG